MAIQYQGAVATPIANREKQETEGLYRTRLTWLVHMDFCGVIPTAMINRANCLMMYTPKMIIQHMEEKKSKGSRVKARKEIGERLDHEQNKSQLSTSAPAETAEMRRELQVKDTQITKLKAIIVDLQSKIARIQNEDCERDEEITP